MSANMLKWITSDHFSILNTIRYSFSGLLSDCYWVQQSNRSSLARIRVPVLLRTAPGFKTIFTSPFLTGARRTNYPSLAPAIVQIRATVISEQHQPCIPTVHVFTKSAVINGGHTAHNRTQSWCSVNEDSVRSAAPVRRHYGPPSL